MASKETDNNGRLDGRTALVTGAGSGIGKAISTVFGREGALVMASDINEESAAAGAAQIEDAGGQARSMRTDTTSEEDVKGAIQAVVDAWSRRAAEGDRIGFLDDGSKVAVRALGQRHGL